MNKRNIYISLFVILGIVVQFVIHASLELWYIEFLLFDFSKYGFGLSWNTWVVIHNVLTILLLIVGIHFGWRQGKYWWRRIYENGSF
jgi:hypothetical protein